MTEERRKELALDAMVKIRRQCWKLDEDGEMEECAPTARQIVEAVDEALRIALAEVKDAAQGNVAAH